MKATVRRAALPAILAVGASLLTVLPAGAAEAAPARTVTMSLQEAAESIPAVPALTAGYAFRLFHVAGVRRSPSRIPVIGFPAAWSQGAYGWSDSLRRSFTRNFPTYPRRPGATAKASSLLAALAADPASVDCPQVTAVARALVSWGLSVEPAVKSALADRARACPDTILAITLRNTQRRIGAMTAQNPYAAGGDSTLSSVTDLLTAPPGPRITRDLFGLHTAPGGPAPALQYGYVRLWDAGVGWNAIEPRRGVFRWDALDDAVTAATVANAKVVYVFGPTPAWAGELSTDPPREIADFRQFVDALVSRYGSRIDAYEIWNEPNLQTFYTGSVADLVEMTTAVRSAVRSHGSPSLVLAASTTTRLGSSFYNFGVTYIRALGKAGWPVDGFAFHSYPPASGGPADRVGGIALFRSMLMLAKAPDLPIYETEVNYGLGGLQEVTRPVFGSTAQGYLAQTFVEGVRYGVTSIDWYAWTAKPYPLLGVQLDPTAVGNQVAWRWTFDQLVGSSVRGCVEEGGGVLCGFVKDGTNHLLGYSPAGSPVQVPVPAGIDTACSMDGVCVPLPDGTVQVGIRPLLLTSSTPATGVVPGPPD